jgi:hypothetical protein
LEADRLDSSSTAHWIPISGAEAKLAFAKRLTTEESRYRRPRKESNSASYPSLLPLSGDGQRLLFKMATELTKLESPPFFHQKKESVNYRVYPRVKIFTNSFQIFVEFA